MRMKRWRLILWGPTLEVTADDEAHTSHIRRRDVVCCTGLLHMSAVQLKLQGLVH